ncbi:hypothetical protein BAT_0911 [Bacillus pumilus ATCC 7061]|nr:hypothetical protein BAT_0911 [Bacillus pumilus ATCC 7061]
MAYINQLGDICHRVEQISSVQDVHIVRLGSSSQDGILKETETTKKE